MWLETISPLMLAFVVFISQILFITLRTLNVIYTSEKNMPGSLITGALVHLTWLVTISIGVKSVMNNDWLVILGSLSGGLIGTYLGIKFKLYLIKRHERSKNII